MHLNIIPDTWLKPATNSQVLSTLALVLFQVLLMAAFGWGIVRWLRSPTNADDQIPNKDSGSPVFLWLARLFLVRYALLAFIGPALLYLLGIWLMPQLTSSIYVVASQTPTGDAIFDSTSVAKILCVLVAGAWQTWTAVLALRAARSQMSVRFGVSPWTDKKVPFVARLGPFGIVVVAALPAVLCCLHTVAESYVSDFWLVGLLSSRLWGVGVFAVTVGALACVLQSTSDQGNKSSHDHVTRWESGIAAFLSQFGPGYVEPEPDASGYRLYAVHRRCLRAFAMTMVGYVATLVFIIANQPSFSAFPVLFYALLLFTLVGQIFTALAFWWDYFHVSPLLVFAAVTLAASQVTGSDSYFATTPDQVEAISWFGVMVLIAVGACLVACSATRPRLSSGRDRPTGTRIGLRIAPVAASLVCGFGAGVWLSDRLPCGPGRAQWVITSCTIAVLAAFVFVWQAWSGRRKGGAIRLPRFETALAAVAFAVAICFGEIAVPHQLALLTAWPDLAPPEMPVPAALTQFRLTDKGSDKRAAPGICELWDFSSSGRNQEKTLIIVMAAGGGIQATAWTTQVVWGLNERYGAAFTGSVKILSGVSGGSLGIAHVMRGWNSGTDGRDSNQGLERAKNISRESSLEAVAFGMTYCDLAASLWPTLPGPVYDRGNFLERAWHGQFLRNGVTDHFRLSDWIKPVADGKSPIPIFNSTLSETGRRLVIAPAYRRRPPLQNQARQVNEKLDCAGGTDAEAVIAPPPSAVEFYHLYPPPSVTGAKSPYHDPDVATVVRLSATFPVISPLTRSYYPCPEKLHGGQVGYLQNCHCIDGGYIDNEGAFTALEWVEDVMDWHEKSRRKPNFKRVLFVRILPFPPEQPPKGNEDDEPRNAWTNAVLGPVSTLNSVRSTSMADRNAFALAGFKKRAQAMNVEVDYVQFVFQPWRQDAEGRVEVDCNYVTPLSWQLTPRQKRHIDEAWKRITEDAIASPQNDTNPLVVMDRYLK
jgi:hypothetical protein